MTIAVHISLSEFHPDPLNNFNYRSFTILAGWYPEHHFIFIFDKPFSPLLISEKNITALLLPPQIRNRLLGYYWYNFKVPNLLEKYKADLFVGNSMYASLRTGIKQCLIVQDISFLKPGNLYAKADARYLKKYFKKFVAKSSCICVGNQQLSGELESIVPRSKEKIFFIGHGIEQPNENTDQLELQKIKDGYTDGKEFFACYITDASISNSTTLLKAFSSFKKRQRSNMQLVFVMLSANKENPVKDFTSYKYRDEVKFVTPENKASLTKISAAAYAAIYMPAIEVLEDNSFAAIENSIPLICPDHDFYRSAYREASLYTAPDEKNLAQHMMLLYKDENTRNTLISQGKLLAANSTWDKTTGNLWQALLHAAGR